MRPRPVQSRRSTALCSAQPHRRRWTRDRAIAAVSRCEGAAEVGDTQGTIGFAGGQAYSDLRGLGPNRSLVLLDGRRLMSSAPDGAIDLNTIPQSLIGSVEIITGGASSTYGSDAVAGVVNFKLRRNLKGLELQGKYGITDDAAVRDRLTLETELRRDIERGNLALEFQPIIDIDTERVAASRRSSVASRAARRPPSERIHSACGSYGADSAARALGPAGSVSVGRVVAG